MDVGFGGSRYDNIKSNAYWANVHLDTRLAADSEFAFHIADHLNDCTEQPTVGLLARQKYKTNNYPFHYQNNLKDFFEMEEVKLANDKFNNTFDKLYPKTGKLRKRLIKSGSIKLNYVNPIEKNLRRTFIKIFSKVHL